MKNAGAASTSLKLTLQLGLIANQSGIADAVKAASNPSSSTYGKYLSLSTLQSKYGASSSKRNGVTNAFKEQRHHGQGRRDPPAGERHGQHRQRAEDLRDEVEPLHHRQAATSRCPSARPSRHRASRATPTRSRACALNSLQAALLAPRAPAARRVDGGTPTRTGTPAPGCAPTTFPSRSAPTAAVPQPDPHGLRDRAAAGGRPARPGLPRRDRRRGADAGLDVNTYRDCFGFQGTALSIHNAGEHPADPRELARRDDRLDGRAEPRRSISGCTRSTRTPTTATSRAFSSCSSSRCRRREQRPAAGRDLGVLRRVRIERQALLGVAHPGRAPAGRHGLAGDHDGRRRRGQRLVGLRAWRSASQLTRRHEAAGLLAGDVPVGAGGRRHEPHAHSGNAILSTGVWNDTTYPSRSRRSRAAGEGSAPSSSGRGGSRRRRRESDLSDGPRRRRLRRREPGIRDRVLLRRPGLPGLAARRSRSWAGRARRRRWWRA